MSDSDPDEGDVIVTRRDHVFAIRLDRPRYRNALGAALRAKLTDAIVAAEADDGVFAIVLAGSDAYFSAGGDIREFGSDKGWAIRPGDPGTVWDVLARRRKPLVAAVEGFALGGGCELALLADIIVAGQSARFAFPETRLGLIPGAGGSQRFARAVGRSMALRYLLTGDDLPAEAARSIGLVSDVVADGTAFAAACQLADRISAGAPLAVQALRQVVEQGLDRSLEEGLALERDALAQLRGTADFAEGQAAFRDKRRPRFTGR
jgi:enoyl-CoA hydratase/carnithine racemase